MIDHVDLSKIVLSNKGAFGIKDLKYFIGCKDAKKRPLYIFLSKISTYRRHFDKTKHMSFFKKGWKIVRKISWNLRKSQQHYQNGKINTNFYNNKIPKGGSQCTCLSLILIDSVYGKDEDYYLQVFLSSSIFIFKYVKAYYWWHRNFIWWLWWRKFWWKLNIEFFFWESIIHFCFSGFASSLLEYEKFFNKVLFPQT